MLSESQKAFYRDNGYILIENLISKDEAAALRAECHHLAEALTLPTGIDRKKIWWYSFVTDYIPMN